MLLTKAELNAAGLTAGNITSLAFDVVTPRTTPLVNFTIGMKATTLNSMTSAMQTGFTEVYSAATFIPSALPGYNNNTITFTAPFNWDGNSNIIIQTCFNNSSFTSNGNAIFNQSTTSNISTIVFKADNATVCAQTTANTMHAQRPNMKLGGQANGECVINVPVTIPSCVNFTIPEGKRLRVLGNLENLYDSTVLINENVHIAADDGLTLISNPAELSQGIYKYSAGSTVPQYNTGDILVGADSLGYVRKITGITTTGNVVTFQTSTGNITDVFKQGTFSLNLKTDSSFGSRPSGTLAGGPFGYNFNDVILFQGGPLTITLTSGAITLDPNWVFDFDFRNRSLSYFKAGFQNATYNANFSVNVTSTQEALSIDGQDTIYTIKKPFTFIVPVFGIPIPVVIMMRLDFIAKYFGSLSAPYNQTVSYSNNGKINLSLNYENGKWSTNQSQNFNQTFDLTPPSTNVTALVKLDIIPTFSFKIYNLAGPYAGLGIGTISKGRLAYPSMNWDFMRGIFLKLTGGVSSDALVSTTFNPYNIGGDIWTSDTVKFLAPHRMDAVPAGNPIVRPGQNTIFPVKVRVLNSKLSPCPNVRVYFRVIEGDGTVADSSVYTDASGNAETQWTLAAGQLVQSMKASAYRGDGSLLNNAPVEFANFLPVVSSQNVFEIKDSSAKSGGTVFYEGSYPVTARGVCWSLSPNPTINDFKTVDGAGEGSFLSEIKNLLPNTTYYLRAYGTNSAGTGYGTEYTFTTLALPAVLTTPPSQIRATSALCGGNISSDGGSQVIARGVCWGPLPNPTIALSTKTNDGTGPGSFTSNVTGLTANTTYYIRAYVTTAVGTTYGSLSYILRTTSYNLPVVKIDSVAKIQFTKAVAFGNVVDSGDSKVTERGICWSELPNPTIALTTKRIVGSGIGSYSIPISDLLPYHCYYFRAYATNSYGTSYGDILEGSICTIGIRTRDLIHITHKGAFSGAFFSRNGGGLQDSSIFRAKGVCWSTLPNPTVNLSTKTNDFCDGNQDVVFSVIGDLLPNTTYYVRAYVITNNSSSDTAYGEERTFKTYIPISQPSVTIGSQTWTNKNLNVVTYRNGDTIPEVASPSDFSNAGRGAWCHYGNNPANDSIYGKLYNLYALNDTRGLAPPGWRLPTDYDWGTLFRFIDPNNPNRHLTVGGALKSTTGWYPPNEGATNSTGFSALPGGKRSENYYNGVSQFFELYASGYWWVLAYIPQLYSFSYFDKELHWENGTTSKGASVRCIKDY